MKKLFMNVLALTITTALTVPAFAAVDRDIKAVMAGNGNKAVLTVFVDGIESEPLVWSNNNTTVVERNGYAVSVAIKGNKVDKVSWEKAAAGKDILDIAAHISDKADVAQAGDSESSAAIIFTDPDIGGGGKTKAAEEITGLHKVIVPVNDSIFHCNAKGGNGRVWVDSWTADWKAAVADAAAQGLKKAAVGLEFTQASDDATRWILDTDVYVCPCGRSDWISFSNKSGLPNGKNIQLQHLNFEDEPEEIDIINPRGVLNAAIDITGERDVVTYRYELNTTTKKGSITVDDKGTTSHNWFGATEVEASGDPAVVKQLRYGNGAGDILDIGFEISVDADGDVWIDLGSIVEASIYVELMEGNVWNSNGAHVKKSGCFNTSLNAGEAEKIKVYVHFDSVTYYNGAYTRVEVSRVSGETPYTGELQLVVKDEEGNEIFSAAGTLEKLMKDGILDLLDVITIPGTFAPGKYTAALSGDGFVEVSDTGEIINNGDINFKFDRIVVTYPDREIPGCPCVLTGCLYNHI